MKPYLSLAWIPKALHTFSGILFLSRYNYRTKLLPNWSAALRWKVQFPNRKYTHSLACPTNVTKSKASWSWSNAADDQRRAQRLWNMLCCFGCCGSMSLFHSVSGDKTWSGISTTRKIIHTQWRKSRTCFLQTEFSSHTWDGRGKNKIAKWSKKRSKIEQNFNNANTALPENHQIMPPVLPFVSVKNNDYALYTKILFTP